MALNEIINIAWQEPKEVKGSKVLGYGFGADGNLIRKGRRKDTK